MVPDVGWGLLSIQDVSRLTVGKSGFRYRAISLRDVKGDGQFFACLPLQCCDASMAKLLSISKL